MFQNKKSFLNLAIVLGMLVWAIAWYFEAPPYLLVQDQLMAHAQLHAPNVLAWAPLLLCGLFLTVSSIKGVRQQDAAIDYQALVPRLHRRLLGLLVALLVLIAMALQFASLYQHAPNANNELLVLSAADNPEQLLWMRRVKIEGRVAASSLVVTRDRHSATWTQLQRYVPILATESEPRFANQPNASHVIFSSLFSSQNSAEIKSQPKAKTGYVSWRLLPYSVRKAYSQNGFDVPFFSYVLTPEFVDLAPFYRACLLATFSLMFLVLIRLLRSKRIHTQKLQQAWDYERGYSATKNVAEDVFPWSKKSK